MKVILAVDAIFPPLTGIGRYALELATRLPRQPGVDEVRYLGMWGWVPPPAATTAQATADALTAPPWFAGLRRRMATRTWAVNAYDAVSEVWRRRLLRHEHEAVFHSPNYFLPDYDGPCVATVHDLSIYRFPHTHPAARRRYFDLAFERSLRRADALITDSEAVRQELIADFSVPAERVTAIHLGVDEAFRPRPAEEVHPVLARHGLQPGSYTLSVATLEPRKKLDRLIAAYAELPAPLRERHPLVLVGAAGWLEGPIRAAIDRGRGAGWLRHLGYVPEAELPLIYAGARAVAMISVYEGFGLPVLEAMASGVPVLTSDRSCLPEVAGGAALLVDPDDVRAVAQQLERLLTDETWRERARVAGVQRAAELGWDRCAQNTAEVYALLPSACRGALATESGFRWHGQRPSAD
jgi:alpha-1,3-rhamnosyl/mannosyltransferase